MSFFRKKKGFACVRCTKDKKVCIRGEEPWKKQKVTEKLEKLEKAKGKQKAIDVDAPESELEELRGIRELLEEVVDELRGIRDDVARNQWDIRIMKKTVNQTLGTEWVDDGFDVSSSEESEVELDEAELAEDVKELKRMEMEDTEDERGVREYWERMREEVREEDARMGIKRRDGKIVVGGDESEGSGERTERSGEGSEESGGNSGESGSGEGSETMKE